jgi:hypothetical protein
VTRDLKKRLRDGSKNGGGEKKKRTEICNLSLWKARLSVTPKEIESEEQADEP